MRMLGGMDEPHAPPLERLPTGDRAEAPARAPAGAPRPARSRGHAWVLASSGALLLALALLRWYARPDARGYGTHEQFGLPPCAMMSVTGVPCPGCGVTTSVSLAVHGHWLESLATQPFGLLVVLGIPLFALWALWGHARDRDRWLDLRAGLRNRVWVLAVAALGACWVWKIVHTV